MHGLFGGPLSLGALGPGPAGPLDKTALTGSDQSSSQATKCKIVIDCERFVWLLTSVQ